MSLVSLAGILRDSRERKRAICAFNVANYESVRAVIAGAEAVNEPVIIQVYNRLFDDPTGEDIAAMARVMAERSALPIALHLDHAKKRDHIVRAIRCGYTSVMIDNSDAPIEDNIRITKDIVSIAHAAGVSVEAELGHVPFGNSAASTSLYTDPRDAARFVSETGVDALAVAIGTAHGKYAVAPKLDLNRLKEIAAAVTIPLVLHGGSGTPDEAVREAVTLGIGKINFATDFQEIFRLALPGTLAENPTKPIDLFMKPVIAAMAEYVSARITLFSKTA